MSQPDFTKGNMNKQMWSLAWPTMLSVFFYTLYNLVDAYWVSKLSDEAIAAVSISQITLFIMISLGFGITVGSGVVMAMRIGAKDLPGAGKILGQSFVLSTMAGTFFTVVALIFRNQLLTFSGASGAIFQPALEYFTITAGGSILFFILFTIMFAFNAQGDTFTLTKLFALSTLINLIIDPILIFGWFGIPAMGISGAATATLISQAVFIIISIRSLSANHRIVPFKFSNLVFEMQSVKQVLNIGIPAAFTQLIFPVGLAVLTFMTSAQYLEAGAVAISLGFRFEYFAYLPAVGFGMAAMTLIGQNMGANNMPRAIASFKKAILFGSGGAAAVGVLMAVLAGPLISIFTSDVVVTEYAQQYMWTVALSYGFLAALMVEGNAFQAIGKSWHGFWLFVLRTFMITVPLAYLGAIVLEWPIISVWLAVVVGNIVTSIVGYFWISNTLTKLGTKVPAEVA